MKKTHKGPGQKAKGYVCTNGDDEKTAAFLFGNKEDRKQPHKGQMLWRVQVRKGPYFHKGHTLSATTVIGVEFEATADGKYEAARQ